MTAEVRADIRAYLAEQLDSIQPTLDVMSHPYRRASEMTRRVELAKEFLAGFGCDCNDLTECVPCHLGRILDGDE